jgi:phospholipid-translocating ATPase
MVLETVFSFLRYFLLLNTMLPISLFVSLEIIKASQSIWIYWDYLIYCKERDRPCLVSNSTIVEELGQVHYLFTDKTGTLTRNVMEMRSI